jgi:hypothetical protein
MLVLVAVLGACGPDNPAHHARPAPSVDGGSATVTAAPATAAHLIAWHGPVLGVFVHPLVLDPRLAFTQDRLGQGFQNYFVTAYEFRRILRGLWRNGWTLVDVHRAAAGDVRVPRGRKPLVLSEDDVNYYRYFAGRGLARRLVLDAAGEVRAEVVDGHGRRHRTTDDVVPIVDAFVKAHPEFSADGAKGVLGVTAYEGLFGERDLRRPGARMRVTALVDRLRATGWTIASHSYGHIDMSQDSLDVIARDTHRWKQAALPLVGPTDVLIYPFGGRPTDDGVELLSRLGFGIQLDIDVVARRVRRAHAVVLSRLHLDGYAFADPQRMAPLFSVRAVRDPARP